jgi:hypothetical protein
MFFMKVYPSWHVVAGCFGVCEETAQKYAWSTVGKLALLKELVIRWPEEWDDVYVDMEIFCSTFDSVHIRVQERAHATLYRDPSIYSSKFNAAGLSYQLGLSIRSPNLIHVAGPFDASTHDANIFRQSGVLDLMPTGKLGLGDSHYSGMHEVIRTKNPNDCKELATFKSRALARHETFNKRIKDFGCLHQTYRHDLAKHKMLFEACCVVTQYQMDTDSPIFDV